MCGVMTTLGWRSRRCRALLGALPHDVKGGARQVAGLERGVEGVLVHERLASGVNEVGAGCILAKVAASNMFRLSLVDPRMQRDEVGLGQELVKARDLLDPVGGVDFGVRVVGDDLHPEGERPAGDLVPDQPVADQCQGYGAAGRCR